MSTKERHLVKRLRSKRRRKAGIRLKQVQRGILAFLLGNRALLRSGMGHFGTTKMRREFWEVSTQSRTSPPLVLTLSNQFSTGIIAWLLQKENPRSLSKLAKCAQSPSRNAKMPHCTCFMHLPVYAPSASALPGTGLPSGVSESIGNGSSTGSGNSTSRGSIVTQQDVSIM